MSSMTKEPSPQALKNGQPTRDVQDRLNQILESQMPRARYPHREDWAIVPADGPDRTYAYVSLVSVEWSHERTMLSFYQRAGIGVESLNNGVYPTLMVPESAFATVTPRAVAWATGSRVLAIPFTEEQQEVLDSLNRIAGSKNLGEWTRRQTEEGVDFVFDLEPCSDLEKEEIYYATYNACRGAPQRKGDNLIIPFHVGLQIKPADEATAIDKMERRYFLRDAERNMRQMVDTILPEYEDAIHNDFRMHEVDDDGYYGILSIRNEATAWKVTDALRRAGVPASPIGFPGHICVAIPEDAFLAVTPEAIARAARNRSVEDNLNRVTAPLGLGAWQWERSEIGNKPRPLFRLWHQRPPEDICAKAEACRLVLKAESVSDSTAVYAALLDAQIPASVSSKTCTVAVDPREVQPLESEVEASSGLSAKPISIARQLGLPRRTLSGAKIAAAAND